MTDEYERFIKSEQNKDTTGAKHLSDFKTLFKEPKHLEIWDFIKITFAEDFVELVDDQIKQSKLYG